MADVHMRALFDEDPVRVSRFSLEDAGLYLDYSKNRIVAETVRLLHDLAHTARLGHAIERMFAGEHINTTEGRAVLHTALRNRGPEAVRVDGEDVMPSVRTVLARMRIFSEAVHNGEYRGMSGAPFTDIVNIGIGGSHLGPLLVTRALRPYQKRGLRVHFVSNVDPTDIAETLARVEPHTTLFVIASKTFTTQETLHNAETARRWFIARTGDAAAIGRHFVAVSTNMTATAAFGIDPEHVFEFWDWVGGRYSLWSAIGLPIVLSLGMEVFERLLEGAYRIDRHFRSAPLEANLPVVLGLLNLWYADFFCAQSRAVIPYDQHLEYLPAYLQQLEMESNGKGVTLSGSALDYRSAPVVWGAPGTNGQHAFFQLIHQGTLVIPVDFLMALHGHYPPEEQHELLVANCIAQSQALMRGRSAAEVGAEMRARGVPETEVERLAPHRVCPGNRPSNTLYYERLTPETLGALIALYEHKTFTEGVILGIDSFDQWGVELGKTLAGEVAADLRGQIPAPDQDGSTRALIERYRRRACDVPEPPW
ncbi:MAG: glucose-6-phosphate isomerase [Pseudomonadota bacterium]|nr:glucose-6-phosphate isomerase [Pseudomonadota bacterium]